MNEQEVIQWERRLHRGRSLMGQWLLRRAVAKLARDSSVEATRLLAECVASERDPRIQRLALDRFEQSADPRHIDQICVVWAISRDPLLEQLICKRRWVATAPPYVMTLTALKVGAAEDLRTRGSEIVSPLIDAVRDDDSGIQARAREVLCDLRHPQAIDHLCARWVASRDPVLAETIERAGYIATNPPQIRVLTALKAGRLEIAADGGAEIVDPLLDACADADEYLRKQAALALHHLKQPAAQNALCRRVLESGHPAARAAAIACRYAPSEAAERALFYFLTDQWHEYERLDFDQRLLGAAYESGDQRLRGRIAEKARQAGRTEWIAVITSARQERRVNEMADEEWQATLAVLNESQRWPEMWRLAQLAPGDWGVPMLIRLGESAWRPAESSSRHAFEKLVALAGLCRSEPPFLGRLIRTASPLRGHTGHVNCLAIGREGRSIVSGSDDATVRIWSIGEATETRTLKGHSDWIAALAISPNQQLLATGARDGTLALWEFPGGELIRKIQAHPEEIRCLTFCGDGLVATGSGDGTVRLWRAGDGQAEIVLREHQDIVSCLAVSPDGRVLATGSYDNMVLLWQLPEVIPLARLSGHHALVTSLVFTPDSRFLASGSKDRTILLWDMETRTRLNRLKGHRDDVSCLSCSSNGAVLASGSWDSTVRLWRLPDGEAIETLGALDTATGHSGWVNCIDFSPDGKVLATGGSDGVVRLWSVPGGAPLKALEEHSGRVACLAFSPDGRTLVSGGWDNQVCLWKSELVRLRRSPVSLLTLQDLDWTEKTLSNSKLSDAERQWLELLRELMHWRHRYDIELGDAEEAIAVGEFDIELAFDHQPTDHRC